MTPRRPRVVVAVTFPIYPPEGGGRLRVFGLYRELARVADVHVVCLGAYGTAASRTEVAPGLVEHRVPMSGRHATLEHEAQVAAGALVTDVAFPALEQHTPAWRATLAREAAGADLLVACHPYVMPSLRAVSDAPLWYEAQDVEAELKGTILAGRGQAAEALLAATAAVEAECCAAAELVLACSDADARLLAERYGVEEERLVVVPNGVDVDAVRPVEPEARRSQRAELGLDDQPRAIFVGSWHPPNVDAAAALAEAAPRTPDVRFWIVGGAGDALLHDVERHVDVPPNVELFGALPRRHKDTLLGLADVALNPVVTGSGTNLKMFEYLAAELPVVTTERGRRGLDVAPGPGLVEAEVEDFGPAVEALRATDPAVLSAEARRLRADVARLYDWRVIAADLLRVPAARERLSPAGP